MITMKKQGSDQAVLYLMAEEPHLVEKVFMKGREVLVKFDEGPTMSAGFLDKEPERGETVRAWKITKRGEDRLLRNLIKVSKLELKLVITNGEEVVHTGTEESVEATTSRA